MAKGPNERTQWQLMWLLAQGPELSAVTGSRLSSRSCLSLNNCLPRNVCKAGAYFPMSQSCATLFTCYIFIRPHPKAARGRVAAYRLFAHPWSPPRASPHPGTGRVIETHARGGDGPRVAGRCRSLCVTMPGCAATRAREAGPGTPRPRMVGGTATGSGA